MNLITYQSITIFNIVSFNCVNILETETFLCQNSKQITVHEITLELGMTINNKMSQSRRTKNNLDCSVTLGTTCDARTAWHATTKSKLITLVRI